jgi:hypothetical protein
MIPICVASGMRGGGRRGGVGLEKGVFFVPMMKW